MIDEDRGTWKDAVRWLRAQPGREAVFRNTYVVVHLDWSRLTQPAEPPLGWGGPLHEHRRPINIRRAAQGPVFGRDLLNVISRAKIVNNGARDMAGEARCYMSVWEATGCRGALLRGAGRYSENFCADVQFAPNGSIEEDVRQAVGLLQEDARRIAITNNGYETVSNRYSKTRQWEAFALLAN